MTKKPPRKQSEHYLTPSSIQELSDPATGTFRCTICAVQEEIIDLRPQLVLYIREDPRGIIVTRALYEDLTKFLGRSSQAEEFFRKNGLQ